MAFNKSVTMVQHYAVFVVNVTGIGRDEEPMSREFRVTALITDTEQPLILGSEVIEQQNIVFLPKIRKAIFFKDETHEMMVDMVSWDEVKENFHNTGTKQNLIYVSDKRVQELKEQISKNFNNDQQEVRKIENESMYDDVEYLIKKILEDPLNVLNDIGGIYRKWMILALIVMSNIYECPTIRYYTSDLRRTIYNHKNDKWFSDQETKRRLGMKKVRECFATDFTTDNSSYAGAYWVMKFVVHEYADC